ncbi:hypothetical protein MKX01_036381 [Papaver californicum]|nr:hypothetical protein MKX01_036381 [Papaver californicum]
MIWVVIHRLIFGNDLGCHTELGFGLTSSNYTQFAQFWWCLMGGGDFYRDNTYNTQEFLNLFSKKDIYKKIIPFFIPYFIMDMGSTLLAIDGGLMGPNYSKLLHIYCLNCEPQKASRPWDTDRDGFVMGEGSGVLITESIESAMKRGANIISEYFGGTVTCDAHHLTDPRSDGLGVSSCINKSLEDAGVSPEEVRINHDAHYIPILVLIHVHATPTLAGDLAEVNAIKKVFKNTSEIKMNGTKARLLILSHTESSMIGHVLGASGGLEAIVTIKAIITGWLHPTINQDHIYIIVFSWYLLML